MNSHFHSYHEFHLYLIRNSILNNGFSYFFEIFRKQNISIIT